MSGVDMRRSASVKADMMALQCTLRAKKTPLILAKYDKSYRSPPVIALTSCFQISSSKCSARAHPNGSPYANAPLNRTRRQQPYQAIGIITATCHVNYAQQDARLIYLPISPTMRPMLCVTAPKYRRPDRAAFSHKSPAGLLHGPLASR
jgi:hypothetical protein